MRIKMQQSIEQKTTEEAFTEFIKYCKIKNLARDSIIYYENCFKSFTKFYPTQNSIHDVSLSTIQDYILFQKQLNINPIAINSNLRGTRAFLYYCMKLGYLNKFQIELIKAEKKVKQVYTDAELNLLLKRPNLKQCSFSEYRNWVTVIVESISRFARNTKDLLELIETLSKKQVEFISKKENIDTCTPTGKFMLTVFGAVAELEREYILQRQAEGIAIAKQEGKYKGRKRIENDKFERIYMEWKADPKKMSAKRAMELLGMKRNTFYRRVNEHEAKKVK